jgi:hypothetical protein
MPPRSSNLRPPGRGRTPLRTRRRRSPVAFTPEVAAEICERLGSGETWYRIAGTGRLPCYTTLYDWTRRYPEFAEALAQAQEIGADAKFEKALAVAEDATAATVTADRLHVSTLMKHAEKLAPQKYGAARDGGGEGGRTGAARMRYGIKGFAVETLPDGTQRVRAFDPAKGEEP